MKPAKLPAAFRFYVHILEAQRAYIKLQEQTCPTDRWEAGKRMIDAIGKLKSCAETCDAHQAWACFEVSATTWEGMRAETERTIAQVERILARYTRGAVTRIDR